MRKKSFRNRKNATNSKTNSSNAPISIDDEVFLQLWFASKHTFLAIRRLLPSAQLLRVKYYFEDYGCLRCGRSNVLYRANGFCKAYSIVARCRLVLAFKAAFQETWHSNF